MTNLARYGGWALLLSGTLFLLGLGLLGVHARLFSLVGALRVAAGRALLADAAGLESGSVQSPASATRP